MMCSIYIEPSYIEPGVCAAPAQFTPAAYDTCEGKYSAQIEGTLLRGWTLGGLHVINL